MIKVIVPVSGGKDSQACLKLATEKFPKEEILGLFCDTQFEHPMTYQHIADMEQRYGVRIVRVSGGSVEEQVLKWGRFPGGGARHCTDYLKIQITKKFLKEFTDFQGTLEVWYGMRWGESSERAKRYERVIDDFLYEPHEVQKKYPKYLGKKGIRFRLPIVEWTDADVFSFLEGVENPLYSAGFDRVGCFPCLAGGDKAKEKAFAFDAFGAEQKKKVILLEKAIGKSVWTSKGGKQRNSDGCSFCTY
jgi:3'-phosphoadenosine 5'-phosphosulfate sulfotransferase (PAPS reductase)/FAD synthetase